jgi:pyruvate ferredoxin oxidoreductase alpha subunit
MTATSSQGLALMWEVVYIASSLRLPIVMPVVNRALSGNINIHCDHSDTMGARDSGWIHMYAENAQEAYENTILAMRIAEHKDVLLPIMVCQDGFITSHGVEGVELFPDEAVKKFVGEYKSGMPVLLDIDNPVTYGPLDLPDYYFEHKRQQAEAMKNALSVIPKVMDEFNRQFNRKHDLIEEYRLDDAETAIVVLSSTAGTTKAVVDDLRKKGLKAGLLRPCLFRPFPKERMIKALSKIKAVAVLDRSESFSGCGGPLFNEIKSAMYESQKQPALTNYIFGLGGRDITTDDILGVYNELSDIAKTGKVKDQITYLGVRE